MKQLVFIHGGDGFNTYEDYLASLRQKEYEPFKEFGERWKATLPKELGEDWQCFYPAMPSRHNAKYLEWRIWFEKVLPYLKDDVVFVGHSLGGIFLAMYLGEHRLSISVSAVFLVAAPFDAEGDFILPESLDLLSEQARNIYMYHSTDDPIVPFSALEKYKEKLPEAVVRTFSDKGHFLQEEFPELIEDIQSI